MPVYSTDLSESDTIGVTLCPSGDVLLRFKTITEFNEQIKYVWVRFQRQESAKARQARIKKAKESIQISGILYGISKCVAVRPSTVVRILRDDEGCALEVIGLADQLVAVSRRIPCDRYCAQVVAS